MADDLVSAIRIASSGLNVQSQRLRVVSENLANINSTGETAGADAYRRKTISFQSVLDSTSGATLVRVSSIGQDSTPFRLEHRPGHSAADENGYIKLPNVNALVEMTDLREANRSYQANLQVVRQSREMVNSLIELMRGR
ncbi:MAG: flagellar basal body rod protein FlgC [Pseudomonadota bacterium]